MPSSRRAPRRIQARILNTSQGSNSFPQPTIGFSNNIVERVHGWKKCNGKFFFKVKWVGLPLNKRESKRWQPIDMYQGEAATHFRQFLEKIMLF